MVKNDQKWPKILLVFSRSYYPRRIVETNRHTLTHTHTHTHTHTPPYRLIHTHIHTLTHMHTHTHTPLLTHGDTDEYFRDLIVAIKEPPAPNVPGF